jgi:hypothetical protein
MEMKFRNVRFQVLTVVSVKRTLFWEVTQCNPVDVHRRFGRRYCLYIQARRVSQATSKNKAANDVNVEVLRSSETSVKLYRTTRRHIPEDGALNVRTVYIVSQFWSLYYFGLIISKPVRLTGENMF